MLLASATPIRSDAALKLMQDHVKRGRTIVRIVLHWIEVSCRSNNPFCGFRYDAGYHSVPSVLLVSQAARQINVRA